MRDFYLKNRQALQDFLILGATILFCFLFFRYLFPIFLPFLVGWLLSLMFRPLATYLEKRHIPRWIASLFCILLFLGLISLFVALIGNRIATQAQSFLRLMPQYMLLIQNALERFWTQLDSLLVVLIRCKISFKTPQSSSEATCPPYCFRWYRAQVLLP